MHHYFIALCILILPDGSTDADTPQVSFAQITSLH